MFPDPRLQNLSPDLICREFRGGGDQFIAGIRAGRHRPRDFDRFRVMCWGDVKRPLRIRVDGQVHRHREGDAQAIAIINDRRDRAGLPRPLHVSETRLYRMGSNWHGVPGPVPSPREQSQLRWTSDAADPGRFNVNFAEWVHWHGLEMQEQWVTNPYNFQLDFDNSLAVVQAQVMSLTSQFWLRWQTEYLVRCRQALGLDGYLLGAPKWQWTYSPHYYGTANRGDYVYDRMGHAVRHIDSNRHRRWLAADILLGWQPGQPAKEVPYHHDYWNWDCHDAMLAWTRVTKELKQQDPAGIIISTVHGFGRVNGPSSPTDHRALYDYEQALQLNTAGARDWAMEQLRQQHEVCDYFYPPGSLRDTDNRFDF